MSGRGPVLYVFLFSSLFLRALKLLQLIFLISCGVMNHELHAQNSLHCDTPFATVAAMPM